MPDDRLVILTVAGMALITLLTRVTGPALMQLIRSSPAVERFLKAMSSSVIVAIVATVIAQGGAREGAAVLIAVAAVAVFRSALVGMVAGTASAAVWRLAVGS